MPEELNILGDNYITFVVMALKIGRYLCEPLAVLRLHGENILSMDSAHISRHSADVKVAAAIRRNFPALSNRADRLVSITLAKSWRMKVKDELTCIQLKDYLSTAPTVSKCRIYVGSILRSIKRLLSSILENSNSKYLPVTLSDEAKQTPSESLARTQV